MNPDVAVVTKTASVHEFKEARLCCCGLSPDLALSAVHAARLCVDACLQSASFPLERWVTVCPLFWLCA